MALAPDNWTAWFDRHGAAMLMLARQRVVSRADAEDVVQNAFIRFWKQRAGVKDSQAYLFRCVQHAAVDFIRSGRRRRAREQAPGQYHATACEPLFVRDLQAAERQARIETALGHLPAEQREVLVLKIWADLTFSQIAAVLDAPLNTVASRYRYALSALRGELIEELVP